MTALTGGYRKTINSCIDFAGCWGATSKALQFSQIIAIEMFRRSRS